MDPSEPALPVPLPRPLSDPLRRYRWIILLFVLPSIAIGLLLPNVQKVRVAAARVETKNNTKQIADAIRNFRDANGALPPGVGVKNSEPIPATNDPVETIPAPRPQIQNNVVQNWTLLDLAEAGVYAASFTLLLCAFFILPRRATNAIYLRSFRNDAETGALRGAAQMALGRRFRLSGIRDPRRRWPALVRHLLYVLFLLRYAQPRFMNLEAGRDWKARLWRSLGKARCALIDVTQLTPFVHEEIELAIRCLGFDRVLFIGDGSRTAEEWRQVTLTALGSPVVPTEDVQVAVWADTSEGRALFKEQVRAFRGRLPAKPPGDNPATFPVTALSSDPCSDAVTGESWNTFLLANMFGLGILGAMTWATIRVPEFRLVWLVLGVLYVTLAFLLLLQYSAVCGSLRERLRIGTIFLVAAVFTSMLGFKDFDGLSERFRNTAAPDTVQNNSSEGIPRDPQREDAALVARYGLHVGPASESRREYELAADVRRVDAFLEKYRGTEAARDFEIWRAQAGKVLDKWQAEDTKARAEPLKVPLADLLAEHRKDQPAADAKYQRKWLLVTGTVSKVTREPIQELTADGTVKIYMSPSDAVRHSDRVALTVKLVVEPGAEDALECHCIIETGAGGAEVKGMATIKEGEKVTILGRWQPRYSVDLFSAAYPGATYPGGTYPSLFLPGEAVSRTPCALAQCELTR